MCIMRIAHDFGKNLFMVRIVKDYNDFMDDNTYKQFCAVLSPDVKTRFEHIRSYVYANRASVMVGAGFSKNAETSDSAGMKDWNELAKVFYKKLNCEEPGDADLVFVSPMKLASMVEATFGKKVLDELIEETLSPKDLKPGMLHEMLLDIPWHDVFTTNYDTLLESADAACYYTLVENRESLLYSSSPRIIKLHGSFRHAHPYVITDEDYRTYPQRHPEMVNTMRQSMVENLFCLIGFSGNDPNFLSWMGWLRDVMGNDKTPAYMIAYDKNMHFSNVMLLKSQNIHVVNLATCLGGEHSFPCIQDALEFFLRYMSEDAGKEKVSGQENHAAYKAIDKVWENRKGERLEQVMRDCSKVLGDIRRRRLRWIVVPYQCYDDFSDTRELFPVLNPSLGNVTEETQIDFLYELDFRLTVSFTPKSVSWYMDALKRFRLSASEYSSTLKKKVLSLKVSLLSMYRQKWDDGSFLALSGELEACFYDMDTDTQHRFFYEKCLYELYRLNYRKVKRLLQDWIVQRQNAKAALWKAAVMAEVEGAKEAARYLTPVLGELKRQYLVANKDDRQALDAAKRMVARRIRLYDWERMAVEQNEEDDKTDESVEMERKLMSKLDMISLETEYEETAGFNLNNHTRRWNSGRYGYDERYLYSKSTILLYEAMGLSMGLPNYSINKDTLTNVFRTLAEYGPRYVIANIIRSCQRYYVDNVVDKNFIMRLVEGGCVEELYEKLHGMCTDSASKEDKLAHKRIVAVVIPLLARLCVALDGNRIVEVLRLVVDEYIKKGYEEYNDMLVTIYNSLPDELLTNRDVAKDMYSLPLVSKDEEGLHKVLPKVRMPSVCDTDFMADDEVVEIILDGLTDEHEGIKDLARLRRNAYERLVKLYKANLNEQNKEKLNNAIYEWRRKAEYKGSAFFSFNLLAYDEKRDSVNPTEMIKGVAKDFNADNYRFTHTSDVFDSINDKLYLLNAFYKHLDRECADSVAKTIASFLKDNKESLQKDDYFSFMGGMRFFTAPVFERINTLIPHLVDQGIDGETANALQNVLESYSEPIDSLKGIPFMQSIAAVNNITKKQDDSVLMNRIRERILFAAYEAKEDAALALGIIQGMQEEKDIIIRKLIDYTEASQGIKTYEYLKIICKLIHGRVIRQDAFEVILEMLKNVIVSVQMNAGNENAASETRFKIYELVGILSVWNADGLRSQDEIKPYLEEKCGLMDEKKGMCIGKWKAENMSIGRLVS